MKTPVVEELNFVLNKIKMNQAYYPFPFLKNVQDAWSLLKTLVDIPCLPPPAYEKRSEPAIQKTFMSQARFHLERR